MYHYTESGLQNIWLKNGYEEIDTDYGKGVSVHDVEGLFRAIGTELVIHKPRLSGAEVRFLRVSIDLSQVELAQVLGVAEVSVRGWENHRTKITKPADRLLRALYLDAIDSDSKIRKLIDKINTMDHDAYKRKIELQDTDSGWKMAA